MTLFPKPVELEPYAGVGPLRLGMTKHEVHSMFGTQAQSFQKSDENVPSDLIDDSVCVYYDDDGRVESIEIAAPQVPVFKGHAFLGRPFSEIRAWLEALDPELAVDGAGADAPTLGISVYAPSALKEPSEPVEAVMIFRRGYHDGL
jgi:hypothetical protein